MLGISLSRMEMKLKSLSENVLKNILDFLSIRNGRSGLRLL